VVTAGATIAAQRIDHRRHDGALIVSEGLGNLLAGHLRIPTTCLCLTPLKAAYEDVTRARFFDVQARPHYRAALAAFRLVDRTTWRHYDEVICISHEVRRRVLDAGLVPRARTRVVHPGVDLDRFALSSAREPYFLLPGRIMWQKHLELGLEAWRWFKPHPGDSDHRLVIAGMVDEKSRPYLDALRGAVGWRSDVEFVVGPTDAQLVSLYQRCSGVLFTAANEDFGLVPLEAMACGKPVIAPARGGPTETILDGVTGALVAGDHQAFGAALRWLAELPTDRLDDMGRKARARASEFSWDAFVSAIDDRMEAIVDGAGGS
jgi:glycosyltransferase involved in cell wall biosynthesis